MQTHQNTIQTVIWAQVQTRDSGAGGSNATPCLSHMWQKMTSWKSLEIVCSKRISRTNQNDVPME